MEVNLGYKQTEVGVIPEDWVTSSLQNLCGAPITYGIVQCGPHVQDGVPYIRVSDMDAPELDVSQMLRTSPEIAVKFSRSTVQEGDLVYALRGRLGEVRTVSAEVAGANLTQGTARISPKGAISGSYLLWAMRSLRLFKQAEIQAKGTTFREITLADLRDLRVPLPPTKAEQRAIAAALSDVDALLGGLDRLIAKKRDLKQAAMQYLLTGQTRLPGFNSVWKVKRLGDVCRPQKGELITEATAVPGEIPVVAGGKKPSYFHCRPNRTGKTITISGSGAYAGFVSFFKVPIFASDCSTIGESSSYSLDFIYYQLVLKQGDIYRSQTGGAQPHVHPSDIAPLILHVPDDVLEQAAIAAVLSDMDAGLAALETRRDKTRDLKQAMMQELLTGNTRLVNPEAVNA